MKQIIIGALIGISSFWLYSKFDADSGNVEVSGSQIVQEQLKNVSKLVVTEGYFSDIITYKDAKKYYMDLLSAEKKAVVLVKAKASVSYDLKQLEFIVNDIEKTIVITKIPEPELQLSPSLTYYDVQQDYLNPFEAKDYNKISDLVDERLNNQIRSSDFIKNSKNRLISELYNLFSKTNLIGWKITNEIQVNNSVKL